MSHSGPGNPYTDGPIPTRETLDAIISWETIGQVPYHSLPVGSYYILGGAVFYKDRELKDPKPGEEKESQFDTPGILQIASDLAQQMVIHIRPTKYNDSLVDPGSKLSRKAKKKLRNQRRNPFHQG